MRLVASFFHRLVYIRLEDENEKEINPRLDLKHSKRDIHTYVTLC